MPITTQELDLAMALQAYQSTRYVVMYEGGDLDDLTNAMKAVHDIEGQIDGLWHERPAVLGTGTIRVTNRVPMSELVNTGRMTPLIEAILADGAVAAYATVPAGI